MTCKLILLMYVFISGLILCIFIIIDILPYIKIKLKKKYIEVNNLSQFAFIESITNASLYLASSAKVVMLLHKQENFIRELSKYRNRKKSNREWFYNFPKAFIFWGLTEIAMGEKYNIINDRIIKYFNTFIKSDGTPNFNFEKVVHIPFGLVALNLYKITQQEKYKFFSDYVYNFVLQKVDPNGLIIYLSTKKYSHIQFVDGLGMVIPFLVEYGKLFNCSRAINIACRQMDFYIKYGTDKYHLPFHNIHIPTKTALGPNNWGRGISWYIIGLVSMMPIESKYEEEAKYLWNKLESLKIDNGLWSQFPGTSNKFDASVSIPFIYLANKVYPNSYSLISIMKLLASYITVDGFVDQTSGDTWGINLYSNAFGKSEFTQGLLLLLISISR